MNVQNNEISMARANEEILLANGWNAKLIMIPKGCKNSDIEYSLESLIENLTNNLKRYKIILGKTGCWYAYPVDGDPEKMRYRIEIQKWINKKYKKSVKKSKKVK